MNVVQTKRHDSPFLGALCLYKHPDGTAYLVSHNLNHFMIICLIVSSYKIYGSFKIYGSYIVGSYTSGLALVF